MKSNHFKRSKVSSVLLFVLALVFCGRVQLQAQQSDTNSFERIKARAEQGDAKAQSALGELYFERGNDVEAFNWYHKAAEQGEPKAECCIGALYRDGRVLKQNFSEAAKLFRRSANQGYWLAQDCLADLYEKGTGVNQDYIEAYKWYNIATANPDLPSIMHELIAKDRKEISLRMTAVQIAEAQKLSREFKVTKEGNAVFSLNDIPVASGTGFFITEDGYFISNYHVVKDASKIRLVTGAGLLDAAVAKVDAANDLALLKAVGRFNPMPVAASRTVKLGGAVATVGFPDIGLQGFAPKLAKGEIASLSGAVDDPRYFQISLPVQPGNSGGALVDAHGNVVGIVAAKLDPSAALAATGALPENVNYAVKSSLLLSFLESVPDVASKLKEPNTKDEPFEDVVQSAKDAAVLVLVY